MDNALTRIASRIMMLRLTTEPRYPDQQRVPNILQTLAGVAITPDTAVTVPAVWACLRYLSQTVAVLPWRVMKDSNKGGELWPSHPVDWMIRKRASREWSSFQFRETLTHWALRWGNGYAEIERDELGRPIALWPLHPDHVWVCRDEETRELYYEVSNGVGGKIDLDAENMFHIRGFGEGPVGVNVISYAAESIGWARAAQLFGAAFFGNGMNLGGLIINKTRLKPDGFKRQKAELEALYKGPRRANKWAILDQDAEAKSLAVEPDKAQFIQTQQHQVEEICRWFGVPPHKVMHLLRSTFNNIEHQAIEVVVDSISPWAKRFEDEADFKLFGAQNRRGFYTKMNFNALMRGDVQSRMQYYRGLREIGVLSGNDILRLEDMNTIGPDGDKRTMQQQYTTLERIGEEPVATEPQPEADGDMVSMESMDEMEAQREIEAMLTVHHVA